MPRLCRNVAISNGSGAGLSQGFAPLAELVKWEYNVLLVQVRGDLWAVPNGGSGKVFDGKLYEFPTLNQAQTLTVTGTLPYDGAPGGWRNSMAEMDSVAAPVGDIVALDPNHCFVPMVSALDLDVTDLFYHALSDANLKSHSPFDTLYVPQGNQEHVAVTAENAVWITNEITRDMASVAVPALAGGVGSLALGRPEPAPFRSRVTIPFALPQAGHARLALLDVTGREVATLVDGALAAGAHAAHWDGRRADGSAAAAGIYFARLAAGGAVRTSRLVLAR
jgi:hypothetical protein